MSTRPYPHWLCSDCGNKWGHMRIGHIATWHLDYCPVCEREQVEVTEPRDFGYPRIPGFSSR